MVPPGNVAARHDRGADRRSDRARSGPSPRRAHGRPLVDSRWTIAVAAAAAFLLRLPGLTRPIRADEAGFLLVARAWDPMADSVYGAYFVDRPPPLIATYGWSDAIGGPLFIRVVGAVACARWSSRPRRWPGWSPTSTPPGGPRSRSPRSPPTCHQRGRGEGRAAGAAGPDGQPVAGAARGPRPVVAVALAAGLLAGLALGFKQNLVGGVVFTAVLFVGPGGPAG